MNKYIKYIDSDHTTIGEYTKDKIVFYEDIKKQSEAYDTLMLDIENYYNSKKGFEKLELFFYNDFYNYDYNVNRKIFLGATGQAIKGMEIMGIYGMDSYKVINYQNDFKMLIEDLKNKKFCVLAFKTEERLELIKTLLDTNGLKYVITDNYNIDFNKINLVVCENCISFAISSLIEVITEDEIFKNAKREKVKYRSVKENTVLLTKTEDLKIGDYVVHYDYGISKYLGIKTVELNDVVNDYLRLLFENMELLVPVEKVEELEKYVGSEGSVPRLTKIGTNDWEKRKKAVKEQLEVIAKDLIEIQVAREKAVGVKYQKDSEFQKEFEDDFEYEETIDQINIINDIKNEMEKGLLMDRLVCGDVGFGKTEIAMRAAFKTVYEGKQVVYLAPTTILSRQHYHSFTERFAKFGIKVALLNRMVPLREQNEVIKALKTGEVEIVIGTHRLLNKEIKYKDLGLLIIDEEQRFGVKHKEKIKSYAFFILSALAVGGLSAFFTRNNMDINKDVLMPPLSPPPILFPIVWTILYALMGISAARIWLSPPTKERNHGLIIWGAQLFFNFFCGTKTHFPYMVSNDTSALYTYDRYRSFHNPNRWVDILPQNKIPF